MSVYQLIIVDGKADRMVMATELLSLRINQIIDKRHFESSRQSCIMNARFVLTEVAQQRERSECKYAFCRVTVVYGDVIGTRIPTEITQLICTYAMVSADYDVLSLIARFAY